ncbi:MAG: hypothetical protein MJB14_22910 [Spirochaetes bacterium]|nr:hypothetical protein [Spirochaetota bacterium]
MDKWTNETDKNHLIKYVNSTPKELFEEEEPELLDLPFSRWDIIKWGERKVSDSWVVQIDKAFYSVP